MVSPYSKLWKKKLFILNNVSSHIALRDLSGKVIVFALPLNVTNVYQSMGLGIIATSKSAYRRETFREMNRDIEMKSERLMFNK